MEKYTIPRIVKERICVAPMDEKSFEKFKQKVTEFYGKDEYLEFSNKKYWRIYPSKYNEEDIIYYNFIDYSGDVDPGIKASKTIEFSQIDFEEEEKQFDPNSLIGRKMLGFVFTGEYNLCRYAEYMDRYIGKEGKIIEILNDEVCEVSFGDEHTWNYPAELIHLHLVEEETEEDFLKNIHIHKGNTEGGGCIKISSTEIPKGEYKPISEELDLTKILIEGETYYSLDRGYSILKKINSHLHLKDSEGYEKAYMRTGRTHNSGECLLFPSKEIRTWENYYPFKKGDVCLFSRTGEEYKYLSNFFKFDNGQFHNGKFDNDGNFICCLNWDNCERYDPSKFNF